MSKAQISIYSIRSNIENAIWSTFVKEPSAEEIYNAINKLIYSATEDTIETPVYYAVDFAIQEADL